MSRSLRQTCATTLAPLGTMVAVLLLVGAACTNDAGYTERPTTTPPGGTGDPGQLVGSWQLTSYAVGDATAQAAPSPATLTFTDDGRFTGSTGCNNLSGTWALDGDALSIVPGPMTKRACIDDATSAQETGLLAGLTSAQQFTVSGDRLTISAGRGRPTLEFERGPDGLAGTSWTVSGVNTGGAVESSALTGALNARFADDGTVSGSGGCNTFSGRYTDDNDRISITQLQSTEIGCEPARSTLETQYFAALGRATTYELTPTTLTLRDDAGAIQVMFTAST